ncbi:RNA polymerase sigma factor [Nocardia sp. NBC_01329]|uniref:RNA polymerase sigma factor n=1 Tax=Nocardia sp. NBC_01329 TaxID=2903594 RepID=UPI002E1501C2|nr:sigma-70 family RNA polymerase sigma factor [Nocardia sp. NBC_01329]
MRAAAGLDDVYRAEFGRAVATVARLTGDIELAEDSVQEAFAAALRTWPRDGVPDRPGAWITTTARNRALDRLRRESSRSGREREAVRFAPDAAATEPGTGFPDDRLLMIFTCCHPALAAPARVALTLRFVCGLRTVEIARMFLQPEATVAQRITRAKAKIRQARIPLRVPPTDLLAERAPTVLAVVYLMFTEGYFATAGPSAVRDELCDEAIRVGRLLCELLPDAERAVRSECHALLALMLLTDSRRAQRRTGDGELVPLAEQDRDGWDRAAVRAGLHHLLLAAADGNGPYLAQARIAAAHAVAPDWAATDWRAIVAAYDDLLTLAPSPSARVNRAIAVGLRDGPEAGLTALAEVAGDRRLAGGQLVVAARADLYRRAGRHTDAAREYRAAIAAAGNDPARRYLRRRLAEMEMFDRPEPM